MADLPNLKKHRSTIKGSITLSNRMKSLESKINEPSTLNLTKQLMPNLKYLDEQFKTQHFLIIETINESDEDALDKEQEILDQYDDDISTLSLHDTQLLQNCDTTSDSGTKKIILKD